jgi:hypothetical protein
MYFTDMNLLIQLLVEEGRELAIYYMYSLILGDSYISLVKSHNSPKGRY